MSSKHSKNSSSINWLPAFLTGLLLGGLAGAVAMLLLAPHAGEKTRSKIQKQGEKLRHQVAKNTEEVMTEASDKVQQFADSVL